MLYYNHKRDKEGLKMKRYFINYNTDAITIETDPEQIARYLANGWVELSEEEYAREYARIWDRVVNGRY